VSEEDLGLIDALQQPTGRIAELILGVKAERQSLESIAQPLTTEEGSAPGHGQVRTA
jgi:hypothetical protein